MRLDLLGSPEMRNSYASFISCTLPPLSSPFESGGIPLSTEGTENLGAEATALAVAVVLVLLVLVPSSPNALSGESSTPWMVGSPWALVLVVVVVVVTDGGGLAKR